VPFGIIVFIFGTKGGYPRSGVTGIRFWLAYGITSRPAVISAVKATSAILLSHQDRSSTGRTRRCSCRTGPGRNRPVGLTGCCVERHGENPFTDRVGRPVNSPGILYYSRAKFLPRLPRITGLAGVL